MSAASTEEARLRALLRNVADTITVFDATGRVLWIGGNPGGTLGRADDSTWVGEQGLDHIHPEDRPLMEAKLLELLTEPSLEVSADFRVRADDGSWVYCEGSAVNLLADPLVGGIVLTSRNITARKRTELLLQRQAQVLEGIATGVAIEATFDAVCALVEEHVPDVDAALVLQRRGESRAADLDVDGAWHRPLVGAASAACFGTLRVRPSAPRVPTAEEATILDLAGNLAAIAAERASSEDRLLQLALHDPLTGLPNRLLLRDRLETALRRMSRHDHQVAVLFVDLDRFKLVNDALGHRAGDELLEAVADRLRLSVRPGDTVARFGGDEFVVICDEVDGDEHALTVAARFAGVLDAPFDLGSGSMRVTASIGVAVARTFVEDSDRLLQDADVAMYRAKREGRDRVVLLPAPAADQPESQHQ